MPPYGTAPNLPALFPFPPGHTFLVFSAEAVIAAETSQQVALPPGPTAGAKGVRLVIDHNAAPGNCEYYLAESDNDAAGVQDYNLVPIGGDLTQAGLVAGPNGAGTRLITDQIPVAGQFVAVYVKTAPSNANIKVTARISRAA
jgi:hypothetical protein